MVAGSSCEHHVFGGVVDFADETKVSQLGVSVIIHEDILGFKVSIHDASVVQLLQRQHHTSKDEPGTFLPGLLEQLLLVWLARIVDEAMHIPAGSQFRHEIAVTPILKCALQPYQKLAGDLLHDSPLDKNFLDKPLVSKFFLGDLLHSESAALLISAVQLLNHEDGGISPTSD